jgi:hypothetical protein
MEVLMRKFVVGMAAAAALAATTFAPQPAKAMDPISAWWLVPAFFGGLVIGSAWRAPAYAAPRGEYYEYSPSGAYYVEPRGEAPRARRPVRSRY